MLPIHTHKFIDDVKVVPKTQLQSMTMDNPAEIRNSQRRAGPYYQGKSEAVGKNSKVSHFKIKLKRVLMVAMRDIGSDNGIPQKKMMESLNWDCSKHFASVREKAKAGVKGYEAGGQEW